MSYDKGLGVRCVSCRAGYLGDSCELPLEGSVSLRLVLKSGKQNRSWPSEVSAQAAGAMTGTPLLAPWPTISQAAECCGVHRAEMYSKMLRYLEVRRIGMRGGASPRGGIDCSIQLYCGQKWYSAPSTAYHARSSLSVTCKLRHALSIK